MISETQIPLYQFVKWLGLNGNDAAGIERGNCSRCCCFLQNTWQKPNHWSRDCLIESLQTAEDIVISFGKVYPNRFQIENEQHDFQGLLNSEGDFVAYRPNRPIEAFEYGLYSLDFISTYTIDWTALATANSNQYPETISVTASIVGSTIRYEKKNFRVYYTSSDLPDRNLDFNSHYGEIRPYRNIDLVETDNLDGTYDYSVTIEIDSFLLSNPLNWEEDSCCTNDFDSSFYCYIDNVDIYVETPDCCGYYLTEDSNCTGNCKDELQCTCIYQRKIHDELWFVPKLYDCELDKKICLTKEPTKVVFNYLSGYSPNDNKYASREIARAVFMLALGIAPCISEQCECEVCFKQKVEFFRDADKYLLRKSVDTNGEYDVVYEILKDKYDYELAKGLIQSRGVTMGLAILQKLKMNPVGVTYIK